MATKLATYNYRREIADPSVPHLGFIIEDMPESLAVDRGHDRVDMYGYLSMVLATVVQAASSLASTAASTLDSPTLSSFSAASLCNR